jgi:hypothetical protein
MQHRIHDSPFRGSEPPLRLRRVHAPRSGGRRDAGRSPQQRPHLPRASVENAEGAVRMQGGTIGQARDQFVTCCNSFFDKFSLFRSVNLSVRHPPSNTPPKTTHLGRTTTHTHTAAHTPRHVGVRGARGVPGAHPRSGRARAGGWARAGHFSGLALSFSFFFLRVSLQPKHRLMAGSMWSL